jgi:hypothetical protein
VLSGVAGVLLAAAVAGIGALPVRALVVVLALGSTSAVCALLCWLEGRREDDVKRPLVRELVDAYLDEQRPTRLASRRSS